MAAARKDLIIEKGATFRLRLVWKSGDTQTPYDLTGWTAAMQIRETYASNQPLVSLSTNTGGITLNSIPGAIDIEITGIATTDIHATTGVYDLELTNTTTSTIVRLIEGKIKFKEEATR